MQTVLAQNNTQPQVAPTSLCAMITEDAQDIRKALELRYRVFGEDMGAKFKSTEAGIDRDHFDDVCYHLVVKDEFSGDVVGYSRIITSDMLAHTGGFYTQTEFDLSGILQSGKRYMEIGRTCVDGDFRNGAVIALLWARLGQFIQDHNIDFLMGCASIPFNDGPKALAVIDYLRDNHFTESEKRVIPKHPLPHLEVHADGKSLMPALLKAYLRMGCKVCGEAHWDKAFNVADVVVLLAREDINQRYLKHFMRAA
ncbi:MAG: GNAT family N-acetyltransferase [Oceanospirillaceae bacterium]|nr:GNAT family N-acetyltransferase [Oceanospirillaceae bacterium]